MHRTNNEREAANKTRFFFRPLMVLLCSFIAGIILARLLPGHFKIALAACILSATLTFWAAISLRPVRCRPILLYCALGYLSLCPWHFAPDAPFHINQFMDEKPWQISGQIASEPIREGFRLKFTLSDIQLTKRRPPGALIPVQGNLRVSVYGWPPHSPATGDYVNFFGKIRAFHNFNNPGGFNYESFMAYQNIWGSTYCSGKELHLRPSNQAKNSIRAILCNSRRAAANLIDTAVKGDSQAIISALVLGRRHLLSEPLATAFNRAGASHMLAISGLHIGIVATNAFLFFKYLLLLCPPLRKRALSRKSAAALAIVPVWCYALLAGMSPSTQRAGIMASLFLLTFLMERDHDLINTLAIAALIILAIFPPALFSISFQLSFIAVTTIICGLFAVRGRIQAMKTPPAVKSLLSFLAVSGFAIIGTTPLVMHYFNQIAFFGILTNLLVIPVIGFTVVPLALFSVLIMLPLHAGLAGWGLKLAGWIVDKILPVIYQIGEYPGSAAKTITPSILELICGYILIFGILRLISNKNKQNFRRMLRSPALLSILLALAILTADIGYWCQQRFWNQQFRLTVLDVGQGNSAVLELPDGYRMLIDGGGFTSNAVFDIGKNVVAPFLWQHKIASLDAIVLSHPDADHLNGLLYIVKNFHVKKVLSTHQATESQAYEEFSRVIADKGIPHPRIEKTAQQFAIHGVDIDILYPLAGDEPIHQAKDSNNHSLVLKATYRGHSILLPGDIMAASEKALVTKVGKNLGATVLVAPHHGSKTSSTPEFLDAVNPGLVIVSAGHHNRFDLPSPSIIARYRNRGYKILKTASEGAVRITMDHKGFELRPVCGDGLELVMP